MAADTRTFFKNLKLAVARNPNKARKIGGSYQLHIGGAGSWGIDLSVPSVIDGVIPSPAVTIYITDQDFHDLLADHGKAMNLFVSGKLVVVGNQIMALNLPKLLGLR